MLICFMMRIILAGCRAVKVWGKSCSEVCGTLLSPAVCSLALGALLLAGCATSRQEINSDRTFDFKKDTFNFANELVWAYEYDSQGHWTTYHRKPRPSYYQHCFVVARSTRQFYNNARFDPSKPAVDDATYRRLIRKVVTASPRASLPEENKIIIPGFADLRSFSQAHELLLKGECGGAWQSYVQRGHWRMVFPFSRDHQERTSQELLRELARNSPIVVHLVRFPRLTINHAVVIYGAKKNPNYTEFVTYDPNQPAQPGVITYDRQTKTFLFGPNDYFPGGRVDVYQVYYKWNY